MALTGAGPAPRRSPAESLLQGQTITPESIELVAEATAREAEPVGDLDGSEGYKRRILRVLTRRALTRAAHTQARG